MTLLAGASLPWTRCYVALSACIRSFMASSEVAAHAHFAILSCDVMGTDSESTFPLTSLCHWHIWATNQMRQIPEMLMCLPSLPASQVSCLFISLPVHNQPSCLSWETPQSDCGTVSSENKSVQYARKPVHEKRPDTAGTHV